MKIFITDRATRKKKYVEVSFWSLLKANFLTSLVMALIYYGLLFLAIIILILLGW